MPSARSAGDAYIRASVPVRAQVSRLTSASALRARWDSTCPRVQPGSRAGAASRAGSPRKAARSPARDPRAGQVEDLEDAVVVEGEQVELGVGDQAQRDP